MAAIVPIYNSLKINHLSINKHEVLILESELLHRIYITLKNIFKNKYMNIFKIEKLTKEKENEMLDHEFLRSVILDILETEDYTLEGIAIYTNTPEEIIFNIVSGKDTSYSGALLLKIIELHRSVKREFYAHVLKKIIDQSPEVPD